MDSPYFGNREADEVRLRHQVEGANITWRNAADELEHLIDQRHAFVRVDDVRELINRWRIRAS